MTDIAPTQLESPALFLADHAVVESGKLYVNGAYWNRLNFLSFPATMNFAAAAVILVPWHDADEHTFVIRFEDADGQQVGGALSGQFRTGTAPDAKKGDPTILPIAATIGNFVFERAGEYAVVLEVDGMRLNQWPFRAAQQIAPFGPASPANVPPM